MSLSEALIEESQKASIRKCQVCDWLQELPENDRESFNSWLASRRPLAPLFRASKRQDPPIPVQRNSFERHCRECTL